MSEPKVGEKFWTTVDKWCRVSVALRDMDVPERYVVRCFEGVIYRIERRRGRWEAVAVAEN